MSNNVFENLSQMFASIAEEYMLRGKFKTNSTPAINQEIVALKQNVANILLSCEEFRCILKIHYSYQVGENLLTNLYKKENVTKQQIDDLFKESCNLIAGRIKKTLGDLDISISISIPVRTRGYDEFFFDRKDSDELSNELSWEMKFEENTLFMSAFIEIINKEKLKNIEFNLTNTSIEDEVELF